MKRSELQEQLRLTGERRQGLFGQSLLAAPETKREMQARIKAYDDRAARIERELMQADDAIAAAVAEGLVGDPQAPPPPPPPATGVIVNPPGLQMGGEVGRIMFLEAVGFVLLGLLIWRFAWKRLTARLAPSADYSRRFDQLQQSVDVIALEVERISEGQRYVAKVLNEKTLGPGDAQPIPVREKSPASASADER